MELDVSGKIQTDVLNEQESKTDREHERILKEIETTDTAFIGASLRAVYEGNDHEKFLERLDNRIKQHDREIERMCNFHYQGFIESITELINVRGDAEKLKNQTILINKELQESGKEIARKNDELIQKQLQQCNVASAIEKLTVCLPVLQMYAKIRELMKAGRYYSALKTLEQLEHTYLPRIYSYRFCEIMLTSIPKIKDEIKDKSMSKLKDFLENVRKNSAKIGMVAMKQVERERKLEELGLKPPLKKEIEKISPNPPVAIKKRERNRAKKSKAPPQPALKFSPQHQPRINPFDMESDTEEVVDSTNPFDDSNPFLEKTEHSTSVSNGPTNPFKSENTNPFDDEDEDQEPNPFLSMNGVKDDNDSPDKKFESSNYEKTAADVYPDVCNDHQQNIPCETASLYENELVNQAVFSVTPEASEITTNGNQSTLRGNLFNSSAIEPCVITGDQHHQSNEHSQSDVQTDMHNFEAVTGANNSDTSSISPCIATSLSPAVPIQAPPRKKRSKKGNLASEITVAKIPFEKTSNLVVSGVYSIHQPNPSLVLSKNSNKTLQHQTDESIAASAAISNGTTIAYETESVYSNKLNSTMVVSVNKDEMNFVQAEPSAEFNEKEKKGSVADRITVVKKNSLLDNFIGKNYYLPSTDELPSKHQTQSPVENENDPRFRWKKKPWQMLRISYDLSASDLVDFSPVYKCLHIYGLVGSRPQFETYYRQQRRNQARLALEPPASMQDNLEAYTQYFNEIVGFFVVEDHILRTAPNLISRQFIDDLWDMTISKLVTVLRTDSNYASDADVMMKVKNLIVVFADTLKAYGFSVNQLFNLLMDMRDQYGEILLKGWAKKFNKIFDEDNYTPMQIESEAESHALLASFPYDDPNFEHSVFPRKLPFSRFVPRIYNEIKNFIMACLKYCEDLHLSSTEVDDMIRKSTNLLLTRTLSSGLENLVEKPSLGLTELVQIIINTKHLESSCRHIELYVHSITGVKVNSAHSAKLVGVSTFKDARSRTEAQIYNKLNNKIDEFFELAEYSWQVKEPQGTASRYLKDLIAFLQHNFEVFTNLPPTVAQTACMSACRHISTRLTELLIDSEVKTITMAALQQFNLDLIQCETFSNSEPVPGFRDGTLQMSFIELRQLLDLFLAWDWSAYLADYGSENSKYLRVNPGTALTLLEKIKEERGHRNIFTSLSKQEREKKKLLDTVLRQLRGLLNDGTVLLRVPGKRQRYRRVSKVQ